MIKVMVCTKDNYIISINVTGHANYDEHGNDLVCSSVSSIMFGLCNAVDMLHHDEPKVASNNITISINSPDEISQTIMQTGLIQLQTIEQSFSQNIKVEIQEV